MTRLQSGQYGEVIALAAGIWRLQSVQYMGVFSAQCGEATAFGAPHRSSHASGGASLIMVEQHGEGF
jgi:hypothetical protein